jgi:hypothetical protein
MDRHPTRKAFLSRLMGVELTDQEFRWLVEPDHVEQQQEKSLEEYLKTRVAEIVRRVPSDTRRRNMETLRRLMLDEVLVRSQIPSSRHSQILSNLSSLLDAEKSLTDYPARVLPADKERGLLEFLHNHASVTFFSKTTVDRQARATWFATEENYARTRQMWLSGRFIGMTADMTGSMVALLGRWLRDRDLTVSAIYVSNVPEYYSGNERHALFDNLRQLPLDPDAVILMTRRSKFDLYPMIRPFGAGGRWRFRITALSLLILGVSIVALAVWKGRQANSRASGANVDTGPG